MSGIFDRLQKQLDIQKREQGISALELSELPGSLRKIMRMMLREVVMKYSDLLVAVDSQPALKQMSHSELNSSLKTLVEQNWLISTGDGEFLAYRVNLRRKAGSQLNQDIWAALGSRITSAKVSGTSSSGTE